MSELHILEPVDVRWRDADYAYHINYTRTELIEHLNAIREREQWREQYGKQRDRRKDGKCLIDKQNDPQSREKH